VARGFRIGHPYHYSAVLNQGAYTVTGQPVTLTYTPAADTTPNQFTFTDQTGVALSTVITSAAVTISGLGPGVSITLNASGGTIDLNGNGVFLGSQIVQNGDQVRARVTSSASGGASVDCAVVASPSGIQDAFSVTTASGALTSVVAGVINVNSGLGGAARLYVRWSRPTTNSDTSRLRDLKTFKIYIGTSAGGSQVVNGLDFSTTGQKIPTECRITGLVAGTTYYVRVKALDSAGNASADSGEFSGVASVYSAPARSYTDINSTTTISVAGDYRLGSSFTGQITISANGVYLYGNGKTITHTSSPGIVIASGVSTFWIDQVTFSRTSGTGANISVSGNLGSGGQISGCTFTVINGSKGIDGGGHDLGGCRIYGNTCTISSIATLDSLQAMVSQSSNFLAYNNSITNSASGNRSGGYGECGTFETWADTWASVGSSLQAFYISGDVNGTNDWFTHDNSITLGSGANTARAINIDSRNNASADLFDPLVLWNTFVTSSTIVDGPMIRVRGGVGPASIGYNSFDCGTGWPAISFGDDQDGGKYPAFPRPFGGYLYGNTCTNYGSVGGLGFYGGSGWSNTLSTWQNTWGKQNASVGGDGTSGAWDSNQDNLTLGTVKVGGSTWREFGITGPTTNFSVQGAWIGFNPLSDTPSAPGTPIAVVGVP